MTDEVDDIRRAVRRRFGNDADIGNVVIPTLGGVNRTVLFDLIEQEGLVLGGSSAINIVGAIRLARDLGPGKTIVTILADGGQRYQSKLFNPEFLRSKRLPVPSWMI